MERGGYSHPQKRRRVEEKKKKIVGRKMGKLRNIEGPLRHDLDHAEKKSLKKKSGIFSGGRGKKKKGKKKGGEELLPIELDKGGGPVVRKDTVGE